MGQLREIITLVHNLDFYSGKTCNVEMKTKKKKRLMWHKGFVIFMGELQSISESRNREKKELVVPSKVFRHFQCLSNNDPD